MNSIYYDSLKFYFLTTIAREPLVASNITWESSSFTGGVIVTKSSSSCTAASPSSGLKAALLAKVISTTSRGQEVLASLESVGKAVGSDADGVNGWTINDSGDAIQWTMVTTSTTNLIQVYSAWYNVLISVVGSLYIFVIYQLTRWRTRSESSSVGKLNAVPTMIATWANKIWKQMITVRLPGDTQFQICPR